MNSLRARLLAATAVLLLAFIVFTGLALEAAVRERAHQAERDRLQGLSYALLGSAEIAADGTFRLAPRVLPESDLSRPGSGLYALVIDDSGNAVWRSPSLLGSIKLEEIPAVGEWQYGRAIGAKGNPLLVLSFGFRWVVESGEDYRYTLIVAENATDFINQMQRFRGVLWSLLCVAALALLLVELLTLRWGLAPLRRLAQALRTIQSDEKQHIGGHYPDEIQPLVTNLNAMLSNDQARLTRYRNALGDLAHSLKTPMAILRGVAEDKRLNAAQRQPLQTQLARMNDILDYQLQKAAAAGKRSLAAPIAIAPVAEKLARALTKVYAEQATTFQTEIAQNLRAPIDEGDLTEVLGNLMDNAAKYGGSRVRVYGEAVAAGLRLVVDDEGDGFPDGVGAQLLERGVRADTSREGQGLGLAVAAEIVNSYTGKIELTGNPAGGARVVVLLPAA